MHYTTLGRTEMRSQRCRLGAAGSAGWGSALAATRRGRSHRPSAVELGVNLFAPPLPMPEAVLGRRSNHRPRLTRSSSAPKRRSTGAPVARRRRHRPPLRQFRCGSSTHRLYRRLPAARGCRRRITRMRWRSSPRCCCASATRASSAVSASPRPAPARICSTKPCSKRTQDGFWDVRDDRDSPMMHQNAPSASSR